MSFDDSPILGYNPNMVEISNSEMQTFKRCRRRWWLEYYRGLKPKKKDYMGALSLGTRIHNALEKFYIDGADPVETYKALYEADYAAFIRTEQHLDDVKLKKFTSEGELGRIMVEGYIDWLKETNADADIEVIGAEQKLSHHLNGFDGRVYIIGKTDLKVVRKSTGHHAILDHKTAATFNDYLTSVRMAEQLMLYVLLEKLDPVNGDPDVDGGIYNLLKKVKRTAKATPPFYDRVDVRFNDTTLHSFWMRVQGTITDMMNVRQSLDAGVDHRFVAYPTQKMDWSCNLCPFFNVCTMFDDGSDAEGFLEEYFEKTDPNERYENDETKGK